MSDDRNLHLTDSSNAERKGAAADLLRMFHDAQATLVASLEEVLTAGIASPRELIDEIGIECLDQSLSPSIRARLLEAALHAGREGVPFDDEAALRVVTAEVIARSLPLDRLRSVVEALCTRQVAPSTASLVAPPPARRTTTSSGSAPRSSRGQERAKPRPPTVRPPPLPGQRGPAPPPFPVAPEPTPRASGVTDSEELEALGDEDLAPETSNRYSNKPHLSVVAAAEAALSDDDEINDENVSPTRRSVRPPARGVDRASRPPTSESKKGPPSRRR